jgi:hypothetical protein
MGILLSSHPPSLPVPAFLPPSIRFALSAAVAAGYGGPSQRAYAT